MQQDNLSNNAHGIMSYSMGYTLFQYPTVSPKATLFSFVVGHQLGSGWEAIFSVTNSLVSTVSMRLDVNKNQAYRVFDSHSLIRRPEGQQQE